MWNPWEWLRLFYETSGHKHPTLSAIGLVLMFAAAGFLVWWRLETQYQKDHSVLANTVSIPSPPFNSAPASLPDSNKQTDAKGTASRGKLPQNPQLEPRNRPKAAS